MLTRDELNEVQGLLTYLNSNMNELKPEDHHLIDSNGAEAALIGYDDTEDAYVLKAVPLV